MLDLPFDLLYYISTFLFSNHDTIAMITTNKKMYQLAKRNGYIKSIYTCLCPDSKLYQLPTQRNIGKIMIDTRRCLHCETVQDHCFITSKLFPGLLNLEIRSLCYTKFEGNWTRLEVLRCYSSPVTFENFTPQIFPRLRSLSLCMNGHKNINLSSYVWPFLEELKCISLEKFHGSNFPILKKLVMLGGIEINFNNRGYWPYLETIYCPELKNLKLVNFPALKKLYTNSVISSPRIPCQFPTNFKLFQIMEFI